MTNFPVAGLNDLANETRVIATPWSRMVRGIGLGQHPVHYDPDTASDIRFAFDLLDKKEVTASSPYTRFSVSLTELILSTADPEVPRRSSATKDALRFILDDIRAVENPYFRVMAGCILMDTFAKLKLDRQFLVSEGIDIPDEILQATDTIEPDQIKDENAGRHGHYEKLSAYSAVFLAMGQLGFQDRLITGTQNYISKSLELLESIPAPFFRGRGGSTLLSVIFLLGYGDYIHSHGRDYIKETLHYLDRADEIRELPAFPQPMSDAFAKAYPLLTMLNSIAMSGRAPEYLNYRRDRLAETKELIAELAPVERTHMGLYYLIALHNLGRLNEQLPDVDAFVSDIVKQWEHTDPGRNYFLNGIAYAYIIQTALVSGRMSLISDSLLERYVAGFPDLDRTDDDRINRPYPFAYALNVLGEIGESKRLFTPHSSYGGESPIEWVIGALSDGGREEGRLYMLNHALVSYALRLRGPQVEETPLFSNFRFS